MPLWCHPYPFTMMIPWLIFIFLNNPCSAIEGYESIQIHHLHAAIGSSVSFPRVIIIEDTFLDLKRADETIVLTCYYGCTVRDPYTSRVIFNQHNGTFQLTELKKEDSGIYEYHMNFTLKERINLQVMVPVMNSDLLKEEVKNESQCLINFTCQADGEGPFNFTFLKNYRIIHSDVSKDNFSSLTLIYLNPGTSGTYTCIVSNQISNTTSPAIGLPISVKNEQIVTAFFVIGWGVTILCIHLIDFFKWWKQQRAKNGVDQDFRKPSLCSRAFTLASRVFGFINEFLAMFSVYGGFIPEWCLFFPAFVLLCRIMFWIIVLINKQRKSRVKKFPAIENFCDRVMFISNVFGVPTFIIVVLVIFGKNYYCPCGMTYIWQLITPIFCVPIVFLALLFFFYISWYGDMETQHLYAEIGSSVSFPRVIFNDDTFVDLKRGDGTIVVTCFPECTVLDPYIRRSIFNQHNGTFQLTKLKKEDNGTYEYHMNFTLKTRIYLQVIVPVMKPALLKDEVKNESQCLINFTCRADGDGPFNFTFLRNFRIIHSYISKDNLSSLILNSSDPGTSGRFACIVSNQISNKTSPAIDLLIPVRTDQTVMALIVFGLLLQWGITMSYSLLKKGFLKCRERRRLRDGHNSEVDPDFRAPSLRSKAFTLANSIFGSITDILEMVISFGGFIPVWCCVFPAIVFLFRLIWLYVSVEHQRRCVESLCICAIGISSIVGVPAFCVAVIVIFSTRYNLPCGMTYGWQFYLLIGCVPAVYLGLIYFSYICKEV
ncbi:uncharacterized protein [Pyxicephalus adspersus]|uniref:uncharacterized protein isoform X2 n=1 Tax=Pyxicephalus adspersus TaxID=30357 RepID=UPI003B5BFB73